MNTITKGKMIGLAHIGLFITDVEKTKRFYNEVLGFEVSYEVSLPGDNGETKICFLTLGDLCIEAVQLPQPEKRCGGWIDHIAIKVENIEMVKKQLEQKGIEFETTQIMHGPTVWENGLKWIIFRGPDQERLEINEVL